VVGKYAPDAIIGVVGDGIAAGAPAASAAAALPAGMNYYTKEEVAKHTTKTDCWVILDGKVLNVTNFLADHPGGELAILTFAGKDATEEFNMIHPPDVVGKYAPDATIGVVGTAPVAGATGAAAPVAMATPARKDIGDERANHHAWGEEPGQPNWRVEGYDDNPGVFIINVKSYVYAFLYLWMAIIIEVLKTIFCNKNFKISNDRVGLTRSAILLILFIVIHAVGNLHVFEGPDDFNGYGYFYVRLYWTGFGLPANIVEEYILLSACLHVVVALKRTWDMKLKMGVRSGALNLAISGLVLLTFMTIHLLQFRFGETDDYMVRPPPYLIYFSGILKLQLFWSDDAAIAPVPVRDIYKLEFERFLMTDDIGGAKVYTWSVVYIVATCVFLVHAILGWDKVIPALGIPSLHQKRVSWIGRAIFVALAVVYISFPVFVMFKQGVECGKAMTVNGTNLNLVPHLKDDAFSYAVQCIHH